MSPSRYLFVFSQVHPDFRSAEFKAVTEIFDIPFDETLINKKEYLYVLEMATIEHVQQILSRAMLVKYAIQIYGSGDDHGRMHVELKKKAHLFDRFNVEGQSFAIRVRPFGRKRDLSYMNETIAGYGQYLPLQNANIDLVNPTNTFNIVEQYNEKAKGFELEKVMFGRFIGFGSGHLKTKYNLRDRSYIGNTTMDPELSFIQANLVKADKGKIGLDPFVGTGGLILPLAEFGCYVTGTELNYQIARSIGKSSRVGEGLLTEKTTHRANFEQYGLLDKFMYHCHADASHHELWRLQKDGSGIYDIVVADPAYGIREKARKIGYKTRKDHWTMPSSEHQVHFPEKQTYDITTMNLDLVNLGARNLVVGGRIGYWFPVFPQEYSDDVVPLHPSLRLVANCEQPLGIKYSRRLLVFEKIKNTEVDEAAYVTRDIFKIENVRQRIFNS
uniref:UPF0020 domain-containing protein n=1 Tax=Rhabditophanes sp. KR3021 TaxID=114890 RepID=A0AC35TRD1_9BILA